MNKNILNNGSIQINEGNTIMINNKQIFINGILVDNKPLKYSNSQNLAQINNKIYLNGYEFKNGKWKRTISAFLYNIF